MKNIKRTFVNHIATEEAVQKNGYDCGVFLCAYAYCVCHDLPIETFTQRHMSFFRRHILLSVSQGSLHDLLTYPQLVGASRADIGAV